MKIQNKKEQKIDNLKFPVFLDEINDQISNTKLEYISSFTE